MRDKKIEKIRYKKLKSERECLGLSLKNVCQITDIPYHRMQEIESGSAIPTSDEVKLLSDCYNKPISYWMTDYSQSIKRITDKEWVNLPDSIPVHAKQDSVFYEALAKYEDKIESGEILIPVLHIGDIVYTESSGIITEMRITGINYLVECVIYQWELITGSHPGTLGFDEKEINVSVFKSKKDINNYIKKNRNINKQTGKE